MSNRHTLIRSLLAGLATMQLLIVGIPAASIAVVFLPIPALAVDPVPAAPPTPIDLDLTSTTRTLPAPNFVANSPVSILVGEETVAVTPTSLLTPGERLAAYQVFSVGQQSIVLGSLGDAVGGSFNIGPKFGQYVNNLVVPQGITAIQNASTSATLNLVGNLTNAGTFYAVSTNPAITSVSISALNIINQQGGLLTSVLPTGGIPGFSGALSGLNLNLTALNNIINSGTISSGGNLSMYAGGTITNALPAGITAVSPTLMALNQLTMQASNIVNSGQILAQQGALNLITSNVTNSGLIQSMLSNLNVQNLMGNTLTVTNTLGTMQALGSIDFQTLPTSILGKASLNVTGGALTAQTVNFVSPDGIVHVNGDTINGLVNISAGEALAGVNSGNLSIASLNLTGDPLIYNTNGDVIIDLALFNAALATPGEDWTFLAGGNIIAGAGTNGLTFNTGTGANGRLTLAAGVTFIPNAGVGTITIPGAAVPFIINPGTSATGGNIQLSGVNLQTDGRDISLQARGVLLGNLGTIQVGNVTSSGLGAQPAGIISITASGAITTGVLSSIGGAGANGGMITVLTPQTISSDSVISAGGAGGIGLAGGLGGAISMTGAGNSSVIGTITSRGGNGGAGAAGGGAGGAGGTGGDISLVYGGNIGGQQVLSRGGDGGIGGDGGTGIPGGAGGGGGTGGNISLASGNDITTVATLSIGGNSGAGGAGDPGGPGGQAGTGGNISMVAARDILANTVISFGGLGAIGGLGNTPFAGGQGGVGGGAGRGGDISLTATGRDINVSQVVSFGGFGGAGAAGLSGTAGGQGGAGGLGAVGGNISLTAARNSVATRLVSIGGDGGVGATGNAGAAAGNGGAGGGGGASGNIVIAAGDNSITGDVVTLGGVGGIGGTGQAIGAGGSGGAGGGAGVGGNISVTTTSFDIVGNNFISTGGFGGAGGNGISLVSSGPGGTGGGGAVGGDISLTSGRDAIVCCVQSTGGVGGVGGSGAIAGGAGGAAGGGGRGGDLSVTVTRNSLVDKLITLGGAGGAGGAGGPGDPGGAGGLGGRAGDISVTAGATIFRDIIITMGGLGGASGPGTPPGIPGAAGIDGTLSLTTPNAIINFVAANCLNCIQLNAGAIQNNFRQQIMTALANNTVIDSNNMLVQTQLCPQPLPQPITNQSTGGIVLAGGSGSSTGFGSGFSSTQLLAGLPTKIGSQCVSYSVEDARESFLQATEGTELLVTSGNGVKVSNGQVVVKAGNDELVLRPSSARVTLKPHAVASIESQPGQPTSIVALDALGEDGVTVQVGQASYELKPGEQILITESPTKEQLALGTRTVETPGSLQDHVYVLRASVNLPEFVPKMVFLQCRNCAFRDHIESKFQAEGHVAVTDAPSPTISNNSSSTPGNTGMSNGVNQFASTFKPIAFVEAAAATPGVESGTSDPAGFKLGSKTTMERVGADHYRLERGNLLLQPQNSTRIDTPHGQLFVKKGAIVLMATNARLTRVRDLHDNHLNDVVFLANGRTVNLSPGKEATICDTTGEALTLVYEDGMSRRGVHLANHAGLQIVTADFSILNAFMLQPLLLNLNHSKASDDVRMTNTIMKTGCSISLGIDRYKGPYSAPVITPGTGISKKSVEMTYGGAR